MQKQQKLDIRLPPDAYAETHNMAALSQILRKECVELFKRNDVHLIVKVSVICTGYDEQFLVIAGQLAVCSTFICPLV